MTPDRRLRPRERIRLRRDIDRVFAEKRSAADQLMIVYVVENGLTWSRLGVSTGRRIGGAVARNATRRRVREAYRLAKGDLPLGLDIFCVLKRPLSSGLDDLSTSLRKLVPKAQRTSRRRTLPGG